MSIRRREQSVSNNVEWMSNASPARLAQESDFFSDIRLVGKEGLEPSKP
jgi:hypothetical protein